MDDFFFEITEKWREEWKKNKIFESNPEKGKPKFFLTVAYPYVNGLLHMGHGLTYTRTDILARYKRLKGYNVLFPQGWHATGAPIVGAALQVKEKVPKLINMLREFEVKEEEIPKFENPEYWVFYFSKKARETFEKMSFSVDWRREFFTTYLNKTYSKFIEWQYRKLREKGFIEKGKHAVVWDPKVKKVIGDHDRQDEFAGIQPQEVILIKFKDEEGKIYPCATLRAETIYGVTNLWVKEEGKYVEAKVDNEVWIVSKEVVEELRDQEHEVKVLRELEGKELIKKEVLNPVTNKKVLILPASFVDMEIGTGIVMSVPAHAPYDYIALEELKKEKELEEILSKITPIPLIKVEGFSELPAKDICEKYQITSQNEIEKLEKATKEIYSKEFYNGILRELYEDLAGKKVFEAKEILIEKFINEGVALKHYILPVRFYSRYGGKVHVKIVEDQWFLKYSKEEWKELAHKCIEKMQFYPKELKQVFHQGIDWLRDWACTHKGELGTPLPWDKEWTIESLSDSTIYMAYYTIAKYLENAEEYGINIEKINDSFFDYVFLGRGDAKNIAENLGIEENLLNEIREEFLYWYPLDIRISAKDLINNHLLFFILHHVAIFPEELWPKSIAINGHVLINGEKMSKSKGNFITLLKILREVSPDILRFSYAYACDSSLDDANIELKMFDEFKKELLEFYNFALEYFGKGRENIMLVDEWFLNMINKKIGEAEEEYENLNFRSALTKSFYEFKNALKWYLRRVSNSPNKEVMDRYILAQALILYPIVPHLTSEILEKIKGKEFALNPRWLEKGEVNEEVLKYEEFVKKVREDIREVLKILKKEKVEKIKLILASEWKYKLFFKARDLLENGTEFKTLFSELIKENKEKANEILKITQRLIKDKKLLEFLFEEKIEEKLLIEAKEFLEKEFNCKIEIEKEDESKEEKAKFSLPGKPSIVVFS